MAFRMLCFFSVIVLHTLLLGVGSVRTITNPLSPTDTVTSSITISKTHSPFTVSQSTTDESTMTESGSPSQSDEPTITRSGSPSQSPSTTMTRTDTITPPPTPTPTFSPTINPTDTLTLIPTDTPTFTRTRTFGTKTLSDEYTTSQTISASVTVSMSLVLTLTDTKRITDTAEVTLTGTASGTPSPFSRTPTPSNTSVPPTHSKTLRAHCPLCGHGFCLDHIEESKDEELLYLCQCFRDSVRGFWGGGETCLECATGYYGEDCLNLCQGMHSTDSGACAPCSGHGTCNEGTKGDGTCSCSADLVEGFWDGDACTECAKGYYGVSCTQPCPCSGHGSCSNDRLTASVSCICDVGWNSKADCSECNMDSCNKCPNHCSGHGTCGKFVPNECYCDEGFGGIDCSLECPLNCSYPAGLCSGGINGTGECTCLPGHALPSCSVCLAQFFGALCDQPCNCSGHGLCSRLDGECSCATGYAGKRCETQCPSSAGYICSGNGVCRASGSCSCYRSSLTGYWDGAACEKCYSGYGGANCMGQCPQANGIVCNGHGNCTTNATCKCDAGFCGPACVGEVDLSGKCAPCPVPGTYGTDCDGACDCVNGTCDDGQLGTGHCECKFGWYGARCDHECPGGYRAPCSGRGTCDTATGTCSCSAEYAGPACAVKCVNCGLHGRCDNGHLGTGQCICDPFYLWPETLCNTFCNCSGHGTCNATGHCVCAEGFRGLHCEQCTEGRGGSKCQNVCPSDSQGRLCFGRGWCLSGIDRSGGCECQANFMGPACECNITACRAKEGFTCNQTTGLCGCLPTRSGATCQDCNVLLWGTNCTESCQCTGHGACDRLTGVCSCFSSDTEGHWSGDFCSACADGYLGLLCTEPVEPINLLPMMQSRFYLRNNGERQTRSTTNTYALIAPPNRLIVGGMDYQAVLSTESKEDGAVLCTKNNNAPNFDGTVSSWCSASVNSWYFDHMQYFFASRETCLEGYSWFSSTDLSSTCSSSTELTLASELVDTRYTPTKVAISTMFRTAAGVLELCFVPIRTIETVSTLHCRSADWLPTTQDSTAELTQLSEVTGVAYNSALDAVIVVGSNSVTCDLSFFRLDASGGSLMSLVTQPFKLPWSLSTECLAITCIYTAGSVIVMGARSPGVARVILYSTETATLHFSDLSMADAYCTAVAVDPTISVGLIAFRPSANVSATSLVIKFSYLPTAGPSTKVVSVLGTRSFASTTISSMVIDNATRIAYAVAQKSIGIVVYRLFLPDVLSVLPPHADRRAGTSLTVVGRYFLGPGDSSSLLCKVGNETATGVFYSTSTSTQVICRAPISLGVCAQQVVEVSTNGWGFTSNGATVWRVEPPTILAATPSRVRASAPPPFIMISGQGFLNTTFNCKYSDGVHSLVTEGVYATSRSIFCRTPQPSVPMSPGSSVRITMDQQTYTETSTEVAFVGPPSDMLFDPPFLRNLSMAPLTQFVDPVSVTLVDALGNVIGATDEYPDRDVSVWYRRAVGTINVSMKLPMKYGSATLSVPEFAYPKTGNVTFHLSVGSVRNTFLVFVTQGALAQLQITQQPSAYMQNGVLAVKPSWCCWMSTTTHGCHTRLELGVGSRGPRCWLQILQENGQRASGRRRQGDFYDHYCQLRAAVPARVLC